MQRRGFLKLLGGATVGLAAVTLLPTAITTRAPYLAAPAKRYATEILERAYRNGEKLGRVTRIWVGEDLWDMYAGELTCGTRWTSCEPYGPPQLAFRAVRVIKDYAYRGLDIRVEVVDPDRTVYMGSWGG